MLDQLIARAVQLGSLPRLARVRQEPEATQAAMLRYLLGRARRTEWGRRYGYAAGFQRPGLCQPRAGEHLRAAVPGAGKSAARPARRAVARPGPAVAGPQQRHHQRPQQVPAPHARGPARQPLPRRARHAGPGHPPLPQPSACIAGQNAEPGRQPGCQPVWRPGGGRRRVGAQSCAACRAGRRRCARRPCRWPCSTSGKKKSSALPATCCARMCACWPACPPGCWCCCAGCWPWPAPTTCAQVWPQLGLFLHGAVAFGPYRALFDELLPGGQLRYLEIYNASEGYFALQDEPGSARPAAAAGARHLLRVFARRPVRPPRPAPGAAGGRSHRAQLRARYQQQRGAVALPRGRHRALYLAAALPGAHYGAHQALYQCLWRRSGGGEC